MLYNIDCYISPNITDFNGKLVIVKPLVEFILWMHYLYTIYFNASKQNLSKLFYRNNKNIFSCVIWLIYNSAYS